MKREILNQLADRLEDAYTDIDKILTIGINAIGSLGFRRIGIFLSDKEKKRLSLRKIFYKWEIMDGEEEIKVAENPFLLPLIKKERELLILNKPEPGLWANISVENEVLGLVRADQKKGKLTSHQLHLLREINQTIARSIQRNRLYIHSQKRDASLRVFSEITHILVGTRYLDDILSLFLKSVLKNFHFDMIKIYLIDEEKKFLSGVVAGDFQGKIKKIKDERYPLRKGINRLTNLALQSENILDRYREIGLNICLKSKGKTIGLLSVNNFLSQQNISEEEKDLLLSLAGQIAMAVERARLFEKVETLSITDTLTGLYLLRHFKEKLDEELYRSERYKLKFSLIILDIDHFKKINDTYGHQTGDLVIEMVAKKIKDNLRKIDLPARYGGDEFIILLPQTDQNEAKIIAKRIWDGVRSLSIETPDGNVLRLTASLGISTYPLNGKKSGELIKMADYAMYLSKRHGRDRFTMASRDK